MLGWKRWFLNQNTIINLSTAENRLCSPTGLLQYPDLEHILYGTATGSIELKSLVAELINDYFSILKRPLKSNQVIVFAGAAACLGALSRVLCNPGIKTSMLNKSPNHYYRRYYYIVMSILWRF